MSRGGGVIPLSWLPWIRTAWALAALASLGTFVGTLLLTRQFADNLPERVALGLTALGWSHDAWFWFTIVTIAPLFTSGFVVGVAIFWLRPHDRMAFFTSVFLMTFAASNSFSPAKEYLSVVASAPLAFAIPNFLAGMLSFGLLAVFFATFPDGQFAPRWMRWIAAEGFLLSLAWNLFPAIVGDFSGPYANVVLVAVSVMFGGSLAGQVWRYRNYATPVQKQQTKWFVFGLVLIVGFLLVPSVILYGLDAADPKASVQIDLFVGAGNLAFLLLPISIAIAILRYRLWDIDILIRKTLQYALLTALLALAYFGSVVLLQSLFRSLTGGQSPAVVVISTLLIAALFTPLRRRVQEFIDRRFFRQKYDAQQVLAAFAITARDETDLAALTGELQRVVQETLQPEGISIWLRK
ncbi:MAG: hypothetical protein DWI57_09280 [Chloroflexi bacterium]|nr:MAG: hypothetical protein DWI57_09280 [Chloroflexota bacterium]